MSIPTALQLFDQSPNWIVTICYATIDGSVAIVAPPLVSLLELITGGKNKKNQGLVCWKWQRNLNITVIIPSQDTYHYQPQSIGEITQVMSPSLDLSKVIVIDLKLKLLNGPDEGFTR